MTNMGIYKILNIENNKCYIGSSVNLTRRFNEHLRELRKGIHGNARLQNAYNKCGESEFEFSIVEYIENREILYNREQFWLDHYRSYEKDKGYNILPTAQYKPKCKESTKKRLAESHIGKKFTEEHKKRLSESQKGRPAWNKGIPRTQEEKDRLSKSHKGQRAWNKGIPRTQEDKDKIREANSKNWIVIDPNGNEYNITNLNKFCRDNNLWIGNMWEVANNKQSTHKGWQCKKLEG